MRLMADENIDQAIVLWLRTVGHDVKWAAEVEAGCADDDLLSLARGEGRVLITSDLDFGDLVFRQARLSHGIVLLRLRAAGQAQRLAQFISRWPEIEHRAGGHFVVVTERRIRVRKL
jgi:predicted nuclease of predicted toxin-antitoxin system